MSARAHPLIQNFSFRSDDSSAKINSTGTADKSAAREHYSQRGTWAVEGFIRLLFGSST